MMTDFVLNTTTYDRSACKTGVVHLGFGAFHRSHQAMYIDDYMEATGDLDWGICAVNLRAPEAEVFANIADGHEGYVLKSVAPSGETTYRTIRSHVEFLDWSADAAAAIAVLARPEVHMVTITVTESGYYMNPEGGLNPEDPTIKAEAAGDAGTSVYAYLALGLRARMDAGVGAITVSCCDNIRQNGKMLGKNLRAYLTLLGQDDLVAWLDVNATFPCSMVDRITPRAAPTLGAEMEAAFGRAGRFPIMAEAFDQWVIEDNFAGRVPDLAKIGVTVTDDVDPYEETKIRILNGGHTSLAYLAALREIEMFDQAMADPDLLEHFLGYEAKEVLPAITIDLPFDKSAYLVAITERFGNSAIGDTVERICADGYSKFPIFVRPTLEGCYAAGITPKFGLKSIASWLIFARRAAAGTLDITYAEPNMSALLPLLQPDQIDAFVSSEVLWGDLPRNYPDFAPALKSAINEMEKQWPV